MVFGKKKKKSKGDWPSNQFITSNGYYGYPDKGPFGMESTAPFDYMGPTGNGSPHTYPFGYTGPQSQYANMTGQASGGRQRSEEEDEDKDDDAEDDSDETKTMRVLIFGKLDEMEECLEVLIEDHLEPLVEAAEAGEAYAMQNPKAKRGVGGQEIDSQTMMYISESAKQMSPDASVRDEDDQQDPLLRYLNLSTEINSLLCFAKQPTAMGTNQWQAMKAQMSAVANPTEAQRKKLLKILNPTGYKLPDDSLESMSSGLARMMQAPQQPAIVNQAPRWNALQQPQNPGQQMQQKMMGPPNSGQQPPNFGQQLPLGTMSTPNMVHQPQMSGQQMPQGTMGPPNVGQRFGQQMPQGMMGPPNPQR